MGAAVFFIINNNNIHVCLVKKERKKRHTITAKLLSNFQRDRQPYEITKTGRFRCTLIPSSVTPLQAAKSKVRLAA